MDLFKFAEAVDLFSKSELEKVKLILLYYQKEDKEFQITIDDIISYFETLGMHKPNKTRLRKNIISSREFVRGKSPEHYQLHIKIFSSLFASYSTIIYKQKSEEIKFSSDGLVLNKDLYKKSRTYIINLADQINASYENNIFDGCAVLMRRLFEILLIHSYENKRLDSLIRDNSGNYKMLVDIVNNAKTNSKLGLSRNTRESLNLFRELGNFSAHKIYYNAKKNDIDRVVFNYRVCIEELLYISGIKK
jgi:Domain of unknown function (DUF4145)